jgi:2-haloalkanoic acid dehalogenase type II
MINETGIKAVLFDWAYTLMDLSADEEEKAFQEMFATLEAQGIERPDFNTCYELSKKIFKGMIEVSRTSHREACFEQVLNYLLTHFSIELGDTLTSEDLLEAYYLELYSKRKAYTDSLPTLRMLQDNGLRLGIVSNTTNPAFMKDVEREQSGLDPFFEFSIYSSAVPYRKPHPSIFTMAAEKLSLPTEEILFVGDSLESDIRGAQQVGMTAVWINREKENRSNGIIPDFEIHHLSELTEIVSSKISGNL